MNTVNDAFDTKHTLSRHAESTTTERTKSKQLMYDTAMLLQAFLLETRFRGDTDTCSGIGISYKKTSAVTKSKAHLL